MGIPLQWRPNLGKSQMRRCSGMIFFSLQQRLTQKSPDHTRTGKDWRVTSSQLLHYPSVPTVVKGESVRQDGPQPGRRAVFVSTLEQNSKQTSGSTKENRKNRAGTHSLCLFHPKIISRCFSGNLRRSCLHSGQEAQRGCVRPQAPGKSTTGNLIGIHVMLQWQALLFPWQSDIG